MEDATGLLREVQADPHIDIAALIQPFLQRPNLLDTVLPELVHTLAADFVSRRDAQSLLSIYELCRVRGYKIVLQYLPVSLDYVPVVMMSLNDLESWNWRAQYSLLLWMSSLVLAPFDLRIVGHDIWDRIPRICVPLLSGSGIQRDAAALLMARLFTRSRDAQSEAAMARFIASRSCQGSDLAHIGTLETLAMIMDRVIEPPACIREMIDNGVSLNFSSPSIHCLWIKILGRAALQDPDAYGEEAITHFLNALDDKSSQVRTAAAKYIARIAQHISNNLAEEEELQRETIGQIWDTVMDPLLESADLALASPNYWSGALFAQAEMIRCLPGTFWKNSDTLQVFSNKILRDLALHFVQDKIQSQGGSNVRDTACYVSWSLFRNVPNLDHSIRDTLFTSLKALALMDSEVQVRRAAAAALQEGLGRQSAGIAQEEVFKIMEDINFHSVKSLHALYEKYLISYWQPDWVPWILRHGFFNNDLAVQDDAACPLSGLKESHIELVNALLDHEINSNEDLHGQCLALSEIYLLGCHHRHQELIEIVQVPSPFDSELNFISMLSMAVTSHDKAEKLLAEMDISAIADKKEGRKWPPNYTGRSSRMVLAIEKLARAVGSEHMKNICIRRMDESPLFVAALGELQHRFPLNNDIIRRALELSDPESRAFACRLITPNFTELLVPALNDYSFDKRGDVGSWVRLAALREIKSGARPSADIQACVWRLSVESNDDVASCAIEKLLDTGMVDRSHFSAVNVASRSVPRYISDNMKTVTIYKLMELCPETYRGDFVNGLIQTTGMPFNSDSTHESITAFYIFLTDHAWLLDEVLRVKRESASRRSTLFEVVRTLKRLVLTRTNPINSSRRVLGVAFNTTLARGVNNAVMLDAIDILELLGHLELSRVRTRLLNIVKMHPHGSIRQRAADAVYGLDVQFGTHKSTSSDVLDTEELAQNALTLVDWKRSDWRLYAKYLN